MKKWWILLAGAVSLAAILRLMPVEADATETVPEAFKSVTRNETAVSPDGEQVEPATSADSESALTDANEAQVTLPKRYPVTEAARYFVPADERRAGNLGGPPPLDFPGGPSDPDRDSAAPATLPPPD